MAKASQYLKLIDQNGEVIRGECDDGKHPDWIIVSSWDWSVTDPAALPKKGAGSGATKGGASSSPVAGARGGGSDGQGETGDAITPQVFGFTKQTDRSTTRLMTAMDSGVIFKSALLVIEEQFEASPNPFYMEIKLEDAFLVDFTWSAASSGAGRTFDETWKLNYSSIHFDYKWRGGDGVKWIPAAFDKPPDSADTASRKTPMTAAEKRDLAQKQINEEIDAREKRKRK
jgi:type VI secretion system secreted protein Hcp